MNLLLKIFGIVVLLSSNSFFNFKSSERNYLHIVGSAAIFPFSIMASEYFSKFNNFPMPIIENNGTGSGIKLFCSGNNHYYPDIVNASRKISKSEISLCHLNGIDDITEYIIGYDGIVIAQNNNNSFINLSSYELFLATTKYVIINDKLVLNPFKYWNEINKDLPKKKILIFGQPANSGTRDVFIEKIIKPYLSKYDVKIDNLLGLLREDGVYVENIDNPNIIVQKLIVNADAIGIIGFNFLTENQGTIKAISVDKIMPSFKMISNMQYPITRPLFMYVKHSKILGLNNFIYEMLNNNHLEKKGLIRTNYLVVEDL